MKKKVVALMTIATMAASLFAGCGEQTQNVGGGTETGCLHGTGCIRRERNNEYSS